MKRNKFFTFILLIAFMVSAQNLDSLISSSAQQVRQYKMVPMVSLEKSFSKIDTGTISAPAMPHSLPVVSSQAQIRMIEIEKRLRETEINLTKVTVVLENMQRVSEKHSDKFSIYMRFFEVIITAIAGIITALIGVYVKGRKK
jgi:hypothetical protein